jgi:hypothetical protein
MRSGEREVPRREVAADRSGSADELSTVVTSVTESSHSVVARVGAAGEPRLAIVDQNERAVAMKKLLKSSVANLRAVN